MKKEKKTLVIHPLDKSTDFLKPIYENLNFKTVVRGEITKDELKAMIPDYDRIMMMGHGTPMGLMSRGQFLGDTRGYIIDDSVAPLLKDKDCVFIWCNADRFVDYHGLKGFYTGMFVSEYGEANYSGIRGVNRGLKQVEESNDAFAVIVGTCINSTPKVILKSVLQEYGVLAKTNPIAKYNNGRMYLSE